MPNTTKEKPLTKFEKYSLILQMKMLKELAMTRIPEYKLNNGEILGIREIMADCGVCSIA